VSGAGSRSSPTHSQEKTSQAIRFGGYKDRAESGLRLASRGKYVVAKLEGIDDRDAADTIVGCKIAIEPDVLPPLKKGEYYWNDLIGFAVRNLQDQDLGTIRGMLETGAHDLMIVGSETDFETKEDILVPWVKEHFVKSVDVEQQLIVVDWELDWSN